MVVTGRFHCNTEHVSMPWRHHVFKKGPRGRRESFRLIIIIYRLSYIVKTMATDDLETQEDRPVAIVLT